MKKGYRLQWEVRKNRLKRRAGEILGEIGRVFLLTGAVILVTASLLAAWDWTLRSPHLRLRETVVRGCKELTEKEILALAAIRSTQNILTLNLAAIAGRIGANPWIRSVSVGREFPNRLVIVVRERKAVALLKKAQGLHLLDGDGVPFKKLEAGEESDLPVLTGSLPEGRTDPMLVKKAIALLQDLAEARDIPNIGAPAEIHADETFGLSLFTDTGLCLKLGFDGYPLKLQRLGPVIADLDRKNLKTGFLLIDLSDPAKVNVQQRNILGPAGPVGSGKGQRM
jgi:cell division protein FtsQ